MLVSCEDINFLKEVSFVFEVCLFLVAFFFLVWGGGGGREFLLYANSASFF